MTKSLFIAFACLFTLFSAASQNIIFQASFENTLMTEEGESPLSSSGLTFEPGLLGTAIRMPVDGILQYPLSGNLDQPKGTLSLWVKPDWNPGNILHRIAVVGNDPRNFEIHVDENSNLTFAANTSQVNGNPIVVAGAEVSEWIAGQWHQVVFTWNSSELAVYADGILLLTQAVGFDIPISTDPHLHIGSYFGEKGFNGLMDDVIIYDEVKSAQDINLDYNNKLLSIAKPGNLIISDAFDRVMNGRQIQLIDWEGFIRNPAYKFNVLPVDSVNFPLSVNLMANHGNAYFASPSTVNKDLGPTKTITINSAMDTQSFHISYFPDRDFDDESFQLQLRYIDSEKIPRVQYMDIRVKDEDVEELLSYDAVVDFSEDTTALLARPEVQEIIEEAARDWVYFVDGNGIDTVDVGEAEVYIGRTGNLVTGKKVANKKKYRGLYIFVHGTNQVNPCICSTGYPSDLNFQTRDGADLVIRSIGGHELNIAGDQGTDGYSYFKGDENWDRESRENNIQDLYDLTKHELGHVIFGSFDYPLHREAFEQGYFTSPEITAYYPDEVIEIFSNSPDHFAFATDPISLGSPYGGNTGYLLPPSRGPVTKLDLLIMQSIGYPMRPIRALAPLTASLNNILAGVLNEPFSENVAAYGSLPYLNFSVTDGVLPAGLSLDPFTGLIAGTPTESGSFPITIKVEEYALVEKSMSLPTTIIINPTASSEANIISALAADQIGNTIINEVDHTVTLEIEPWADLAKVPIQVEISVGATISPDPDSVMNYTSPVNYLVTAQDDVTAIDWIIKVEQMTTGISEELQSDVLIYPNPIGDLLYIRVKEAGASIQDISLYDQYGRLVFKSDALPEDKRTFQISTVGMSNGFYYVRIKRESQDILKKVVISK